MFFLAKKELTFLFEFYIQTVLYVKLYFTPAGNFFRQNDFRNWHPTM